MQKNALAPVSLFHPDGRPFVTITYDPSHDWFYALWENHLTAREIVLAGEKYLELLSLMPCHRLLSDKSHITGDWSEANDWLEYEWMPKATDLGLHCFAYLLSDDFYNRLAGQDLFNRLSGTLQAKTFNNLRKAEAWLMDCR